MNRVLPLVNGRAKRSTRPVRAPGHQAPRTPCPGHGPPRFPLTRWHSRALSGPTNFVRTQAGAPHVLGTRDARPALLTFIRPRSRPFGLNDRPFCLRVLEAGSPRSGSRVLVEVLGEALVPVIPCFILALWGEREREGGSRGIFRYGLSSEGRYPIVVSSTLATSPPPYTITLGGWGSACEFWGT